jgi:HD superfamily phosphodiesterase
VPSASYIDANGIDLGEMSNTLTQKIEELTLYLIEQNKKIETQQKLIEAQQKLIEELIQKGN